MKWYLVGLDLGQRQDPTGIVVVERAEVIGEWDAALYAYRLLVEYRVRHVERVPLGTTYPAVVGRVREMVRSRELEGRCTLIVDGTGAGTPVVDLLRGAELGCNLMPVIITGGELERWEKSYYLVPKRDLISGMLLRLEAGGLKIAAGLAEGERLVKEMAAMRVRVTGSGKEQFGAWREGEHDDLVLALALACWGGRKLYGDRVPWGDKGTMAREGVALWERKVRQAVRQGLE